MANSLRNVVASYLRTAPHRLARGATELRAWHNAVEAFRSDHPGLSWRDFEIASAMAKLGCAIHAERNGTYSLRKDGASFTAEEFFAGEVE